MIPKRIFTIFLNGYDAMPSVAKWCFQTHNLPGYEHRLITLENCARPDYVRQALASDKVCKWAKASDYLRVWYLLNEGGIYLDSDIEVLPGKSLDALLDNRMFAGPEPSGWISNAAMGAEEGYQFLKSWLSMIESRFRGDDDKVWEAGIEPMMAGYWERYQAWSLKDGRNIGEMRPGLRWYKEGFVLLDADIFLSLSSAGQVSPRTVAVHHYMNSWTEEKRHCQCELCRWMWKIDQLPNQVHG